MLTKCLFLRISASLAHAVAMVEIPTTTTVFRKGGGWLDFYPGSKRRPRLHWSDLRAWVDLNLLALFLVIGSNFGSTMNDLWGEKMENLTPYVGQKNRSTCAKCAAAVIVNRGVGL